MCITTPPFARRAACLAASAVLTTLPALAQQATTPPDAAAGTLGEIRVKASAERETATSPVVGYRARRAATATKTDTPLAETPQSVTVVTRDQLVDQGASNLQDALSYAAGVRSDAYGLDGRADSVMIRGSEPSLYLDGLQQYAVGKWYTSTTRPDPYTLERIEVLRGPAGMLFGAGTAAGVVNMVSKRPLQEAQREVGVQFGSWGRKQVQADLTGPLTADGQWSYRLVALHRKADTQVDHVPDDRTLFAPSLAWRPDGATSLVLQGFWQSDKSGSTSQFFPWQGTLLPNPNGQLPTSRFIGEPGDGYDSRRRSLGWLFEHRFSDQWTLRQNLRVSRNNNDSHYHWGNFYGAGFADPGGWSEDPVGQRLFGRFYWKGLTETRVTAVDTHGEGRLQTGAVRHQLLVGLDHSRQREHTSSASSTSTIDAYAPVYGVNVPGDLALTANPGTSQRTLGVYLQDQMKWERWLLVAGLRHDRATSGTDGSADERTSATTKRLGLMYALPSGWSPYLSYTESFTPQSGTSADGALFKPLRGEQVEAGVKYMPEGSATSFTASVYKLEEKNRIVSDTANPNYGRQVDATQNKGLELELKTALGKDLDLLAHFNYTDADRKLGGMPRRQAAVWAKQRLAIVGVSGFSVGAGVRFMSDFVDNPEGTPGPRVPSVTLLDLVFAYDTDQWRYALNINNATDKTYVSTCLARGDCWYGARRNIVASATYRF